MDAPSQEEKLSALLGVPAAYARLLLQSGKVAYEGEFKLCHWEAGYETEEALAARYETRLHEEAVKYNRIRERG